MQEKMATTLFWFCWVCFQKASKFIRLYTNKKYIDIAPYTEVHNTDSFNKK